MTPTFTQIYAWFDEYNKEVFNDTLPQVRITFNNTRRQLGQFYWGNGRGIGIKISLYWDRSEEQYRTTLLHEMCHLWCYRKGWVYEGHGSRWKDIANYAGSKTGLNIQRCQDSSGWTPTDSNKERHSAPVVIVDLDYGTYHFVVKTTKNVLKSYINAAYGLRVLAKKWGVYICDGSEFQTYQTSRSIRRGYRYEPDSFNSSVLPKLEKGFKVEDLRDLFNGSYDCLGVR